MTARFWGWVFFPSALISITLLSLTLYNFNSRLNKLEEIHPNKLVERGGFDNKLKSLKLKIKRWEKRNAKKTNKK